MFSSPVFVLISLISSRSIVFVQLMHFSPDIFLAGKGLSAVDSATLKRANGPVKMAFHTCKIYSKQNVAMKLNLTESKVQTTTATAKITSPTKRPIEKNINCARALHFADFLCQKKAREMTKFSVFLRIDRWYYIFRRFLYRLAN